jgi:hypothetical protein
MKGKLHSFFHEKFCFWSRNKSVIVNVEVGSVKLALPQNISGRFVVKATPDKTA